MDTKNTRKIRISNGVTNADNGEMNDDEREDLYDEAVELALQAFEDTTEDHVACVQARLEWNHQRGLGWAGAVTVH